MQTTFLAIFLLCLAISFLLSGMEAGVFALSRLRIRQQMRTGNRRAKALYGYLEKPENFLWTILVGNTMANLAAFSIGVIGLYGWLGHWPALYSAAVGAGIILFYALIELLPKMIFRLYPNRLCMSLALPFRLVDAALRPLVVLMALLSRWVLRWSGGRRFTGHLFGNRDELRMVMQESAQGLTSEEQAMINRVLDLQNLTVRALAIPMAKVLAVDASTRMRDLLEIYRERGLSRLPVWRLEGGQRRIIGLIALNRLIYEPDLDLNKSAADYLEPALYLDSTSRLEMAFRQMQRSGQRLAIVLGPDQNEMGIISLEDVLRFLFGQVSW
ncbi:MAG TPA: CNNM domain-containing protein [Verrucomicrobiae bacterium]|nr:CNNM domain-containing protein [Verrucomicrobiae bacterium]